MTLPLSRATAADLIMDTLAASGPATAQGLATALGRLPKLRGYDVDAILDAMLDSDELGWVRRLPDGRWVNLVSLLAGRRVTHRLTPGEARYGLVAAFPDLGPLLALVEDSEFDDGTEFTLVYPEFDAADLDLPPAAIAPDGAVLLPAYALADGLRAGDRLEFRLGPQGAGVTQLARNARCAPYPAEAILYLAELAARHAEPGLEVERAIWAVAARFPDVWRRRMAPVESLLKAAGLTTIGERLVPFGTDPAAWQARQEARTLASQHGITDHAAAAVVAVVPAFEAIAGLMTGGPGPTTAAALTTDSRWSEALEALLPSLGDPEVAQALLGQTLGTHGGAEAAALGVLGEALGAAAERTLTATTAPERAAISWLTARAHERLGAVEDCERELLAAVALAPDWRPAVADLAYLASDRGDLRAATDLARRAEVPSEEILQGIVRRMGTVPARNLGRNQPCWCGSDRKYKVCHQGREQLPLEERAWWLYQKARMHLDRGTGRTLVLPLAVERAEHLPGGLVAALDDALVTDLALAEGGGFAKFLHDRGGVLPEDEQLLAEQWLLIDRTLWEVEEVRPTRGLTMRDLRTGDRVDVREATASRTVKPGMLLCCRVLPAGATMQIFGGLEPVPLQFREPVLEALDGGADPTVLVEVLGRRLAPPLLTMVGGDAMVFCEAVLRVRNPGASASALDAEFDHDTDPGTWLSLEPGGLAGGRRVLGSMSLAGDLLTVEASSERRIDTLLATLLSLLPGATIVSDERTPATDAVAMRTFDTPAPGSVAAADAIDSPEIRALMVQMTAQYEAQWLDMDIPALAGLTPREAAADPTRREDLIRLLDTFPQTDDSTQMSPDRLRRALGLD